ncbi:MAG: siphovirus ReqiPepy6 Gp37-like family protein [Oscillospiraceae bacterium]
MRIQVFKPFETPEETFQSNKLADIKDGISLKIENSFYGVGKFTLVLPASAYGAETIDIDSWIYAGGQLVIVDDIAEDGGYITVTGKELKGLLANRITLYSNDNAPAGTQGYDVFQGATEQVMKHYVEINAVSPADADRVIPGLILEADHTETEYQNEDTYMSRFDNLAELLEIVGKNKEFGWDIVPDLKAGTLTFVVIKGKDKTESQSERERVIFSPNRHNLQSYQRTFGMSSAKNAFYATKSGGTLEADAVTELVIKEGDIPRGVHRREMQMNVGCDSVDEISKYALKDAENYKPTDSFKVDIAGRIQEYGKIYFLGDYVTIKNGSVVCNTQITAATKTYEGVSESLKLTFGNEKPKPIRNVKNEIKNKL